MTPEQLPAGFAELEPYLEWALPTETQRNQRRVRSAQADVEAFANAILPRAEDIARLVDATPEPLPPSVENLFLMLLSLAEVAPAIESYGQPTVIDGYDSARFVADETHILRPSR